MSASQYTRAKELFLAALALPEGERQQFVAGACADEHELRADVESLLGWHSPEPDAGVRFTAGDLFAERYRIVSWLGEGGAGEVWRAHDTVLDEPIALKLIRRPGPSARRWLLSEARLARRVTHPSVCRVFDVGEAGGDVFLSMEFVDGEDLARLLRRVGRLPPEKVIEIAAHLCGALAAAHAQDVLHRDLKPANILIDADGRVRITDFGIAVAAGEAPDAFLAGTPGYMAPEQMVPGGQLSPRTDLYALGLVIYELATGVRPSPSSGLTGAPPQLEPIIRHATRPDPRDRPTSALALAALLPGVNAAALAIEAGVTPSPAIVAASPDAAAPSSRARTAALGAVVALAAGVLALADASIDIGRAAPTRSPDAQVDRAGEMLKTFGYTTDTAAARYGFIEDPLAPDAEHALLFWIGVPAAVPQSRFADRVLRMSGWLDPHTRVSLVEQGEILLLLDRQGRLVFLQAPAVAPVPKDDGTPRPWGALLAAAGLPEQALSRDGAAGASAPDAARATWTAPDASDNGRSRLQVEAATSGALPVYFSVVREGADADARLAVRLERSGMFDAADMGVLLIVVVAAVLAIRNARRGSAGWVDAKRITFLICGSAALGEALLTADFPRHPLSGPRCAATRAYGTSSTSRTWSSAS